MPLANTINTIGKLWESEDFPRARKQANLKTLAYISQLASTSKTNIGRWNILNTFGTDAPDSVDLVADPALINARFFEKATALGALKTEDTPHIDLATVFDDRSQNCIKNALGPHLVGNVDRQIDRLKASETRAIEQLNQALLQQETQCITLARVRGELNELEARKNGDVEEPLRQAMTELINVTTGSFWMEPIVDRGYIWYKTRADVICTYRKPSAGLDITFNFGRFTARLGLTDVSLGVFPLSNNKHVNGCYHPHVNSGGRICWGDAAEVAMRDLVDRKYTKTMALLAGLLTTYCDAAPYATIQSFKEESSKMRGLTENEIGPHYLRNRN